MSSKIAEPHYAKIPGFVKRTDADFSLMDLRRKSLDHLFKLDLAPPRPEKPSLVSSCVGRIERILLTIPDYAARSMAAAYKSLLTQLPPYTYLVVATHEKALPIVEKWLADAKLTDRAEVFVIGDHLHFSVWAEDGYVVSKDQATGKTYFVEPFSFPRYGDGLIADFAAGATDLESTQSPLYFQGGNVLIGDDFFFIGADYPANSIGYTAASGHLLPPPGTNVADFIRGLYNDYLDHDRKLLYIASSIAVPEQSKRSTVINGEQWTEYLYAGNKSGTVQPLFHIDMFVTLVGRAPNGKFRVLVGDPAMAADVLNEKVSPYAMKEVFDNIAKGLGNAGFEVQRNPLPLVYEDDTAKKERFWYFATSNNCLVQNSQSDGKIVWLPTYGYGHWKKLKATDAANKKIWEDLGFEVRQLDDFHPFAANLGAVHCIKKYLKRGT